VRAPVPVLVPSEASADPLQPVRTAAGTTPSAARTPRRDHAVRSEGFDM
jgi:hypothetical protein